MTASPLVLSRLRESVISLTGPDRHDFLQGLTTNDVSRIGGDCAIYSTLLTPQGKFLFDFPIAEAGDAWLLGTDRTRAEELVRRLRVFRLRADVRLELLAGWCVLALTGDGATARLGLCDTPGECRSLAGGVAFTDPRLPALGVRLFVPSDGLGEIESLAGVKVEDDATAYEMLRIRLGVPCAGIDMPLEKATILEANLQHLNAVSWSKGCYMGQELTARTHYRGLLKRRLFAVSLAGYSAAPGTPVTQDGGTVGELRSVAGDRAIAHLKIAAVETGAPLQAGEATVVVDEPDWMRGGNTPSVTAPSAGD